MMIPSTVAAPTRFLPKSAVTGTLVGLHDISGTRNKQYTPGEESIVSLMEVVMPRYEFYCEDCNQPFEIVLSLAEYEKNKVKCPKCGGKHVHQKAAAFFAVTSKKS